MISTIFTRTIVSDEYEGGKIVSEYITIGKFFSKTCPTICYSYFIEKL